MGIWRAVGGSVGDGRKSPLTVFIAAALVVGGFAQGFGAQKDQLAVLALKVNEVFQGQVLAIVRPDDVLLRVEDLEKAGVKGFAGARETFKGRPFVSLHSLAPAIKYEVDLKAVAIRLTVQTAHLAETIIDLRQRPEWAGLTPAPNPSFFLNYALTTNELNQPPSATIETGISLFGNTLLDNTLSVGSDGTLTRGITTLTLDDRSDLRRLVLGDTVAASADPLGGGVPFGGLSLTSNFSLDPTFIALPRPDLEGVAMFPSTVDVYVNGQRTTSVDVPPGPFQLQNVPVFQGWDTTRLVIRNVFGQEQELTSSYYINLQSLKPGLSQYSVNVGVAKESGSFQYARFIFSASERYGLTTWFTPGLRLEAASDVLSGGLTTTLATPLGSIGLSGALSEASFSPSPTAAGVEKGPSVQPKPRPSPSEQTTGYAASLSDSFRVGAVGIHSTLETESARYANLSLTPGADRPTLLAGIGAGMPIWKKLSLSADATYETLRDLGVEASYMLTANMELSKSLFSFVSVVFSRTPGAPTATTMTAGLGYYLGNDMSANFSDTQNQGGNRSSRGDSQSIQLSKSAPLGPGYGYFFSAQRGFNSPMSVRLEDRGDHGYYEFDYQHQQQTGDTMTFDLSGSLVAIDGRVLAGPPVTGAFGLIRTEDLGNVEGYWSNQPLGRTDSRGDLFVPSLNSYTANELTINDHDVPLNYKVSTTKVLIEPPYRGGAVADFSVRPMRALTGKLEVAMAGKPVIPAYGTLKLSAQGKEFTSPIGKDGAFFLDSPPAGRFPASIVFQEGTCTFNMSIPGGKEPFAKLGTLRCIMQ